MIWQIELSLTQVLDRLRLALFFTRVWNRVFRQGLGMVLPATSPVPNNLLRMFDRLTQQIQAWTEGAKLAV